MRPARARSLARHGGRSPPRPPARVREAAEAAEAARKLAEQEAARKHAAEMAALSEAARKQAEVRPRAAARHGIARVPTMRARLSAGG